MKDKIKAILQSYQDIPTEYYPELIMDINTLIIDAQVKMVKHVSQTRFTIEEIKNYILSQDSLGDVLYNLKAENIIKANEDES